MNVVTLRYARLVPRCVTVCGRVNHLGAEPCTQAYSAWACPLCSTGRKLGSKQAYRAMIPARVRGLAVFAECLSGGWLAEISADFREAVAQRRVREEALYKWSRLL